jgi:hypothetical protein
MTSTCPEGKKKHSSAIIIKHRWPRLRFARPVKQLSPSITPERGQSFLLWASATPHCTRRHAIRDGGKSSVGTDRPNLRSRAVSYATRTFPNLVDNRRRIPTVELWQWGRMPLVCFFPPLISGIRLATTLRMLRYRHPARRLVLFSDVV